ncbi:DUF4367 domain-containing protein [Bacillus sp. 1P02SD]|uniref:DUF4367 domain-containing protein n=1 Tax=Bacillus sp. 1P02SD TaxID=3132264 RepID=UPI0039A0F722
MEERELRSAKTFIKHKVDIEKFKKDTFEKLDRNNHYQQTEIEKKRKERYQKWIIASVASVMIIGATFTFGGTYIADAAETLINQLFGSREKLMQAYPDESKAEVDYFEETLAIAKENLTEEEFNHFSQLLNEQTEIFSTVEKENREYPNEEEEKRLDKIQASMRTYEAKFIPIQAQQLASFPFTKPTYIPEGYKQDYENYNLENVGEEPVVSLNYTNGTSLFWTNQEKINQKDVMEEMLETGPYEKSDTYTLNGLQFDFVSPKDGGASFSAGMRVAVPEKGYKIVIFAEALSKEEMEKILLSMVGK